MPKDRRAEIIYLEVHEIQQAFRWQLQTRSNLRPKFKSLHFSIDRNVFEFEVGSKKKIEWTWAIFIMDER